MAVATAYLTKMTTALRIKTPSDAVKAEVTDNIEEARRDMERLGVLSSITTDETKEDIRSAIKSYLRWKLAQTPEDAAANQGDYMLQRDELRRHREYIGYTVTFTVTARGSPLPGAIVTFNSETITTGAAGTAAFVGVAAGAAQAYSVECEGYAVVSDETEVTAAKTVAVAMGV